MSKAFGFAMELMGRPDSNLPYGRLVVPRQKYVSGCVLELAQNIDS